MSVARNLRPLLARCSSEDFWPLHPAVACGCIRFEDRTEERERLSKFQDMGMKIFFYLAKRFYEIFLFEIDANFFYQIQTRLWMRVVWRHLI